MKYLFLLLALAMPSCGIAEMARDVSEKYKALQPQIEQAKGVVQAAGPLIEVVKDFVDEQRPKVEKLVQDAKDTLAEAKLTLAEAEKKADLDGDGKVSGVSEWLAYLSTSGLGVMEILRRKLQAEKDQIANALQLVTMKVGTLEDAQAEMAEKESRKRGELWAAVEAVKLQKPSAS